MMRDVKKTRGGFTLTEAMVVIACIVLVAWILIPVTSSHPPHNNRTRLMSNAGQIYKSLLVDMANNTQGTLYGGTGVALPSATDTTGAFIHSPTTRDYFSYLVTNEILVVSWYFFSAREVPASPGSYDRYNPESLSVFTSENNAWRAVSDLTTEDIGAPFLITRNFQPDVLNATYSPGESFRGQLRGPPYKDEEVVVLYMGGNALPMLGRFLLWQNLNPGRLDNAVIPP